MAVDAQILVILGATGSGKSELAMAMAERIGAEILSVDSMQVYRGMDIGTAKPTSIEQQRVRHELINLVNPDEVFTAARFVEMADGVIADAAKQGKKLIATGGTPLYYKSLFQGIFAGPGADENIRARLRTMPNEKLHARLSQVDAAAAARIHVNDSKRLVRALEVHELTGKPISSFQTEWETPAQRHQATWVGLDWDREMLNRRINTRVKAMLEGGWAQEVRGLLEKFGQLSQTAGEATGYHELIEYLSGHLTLDEAAEQIKIATRQLARRQMKWFRRFPGVTWLKGELPLDERVAQVLKLWTGREVGKE